MNDMPKIVSEISTHQIIFSCVALEKLNILDSVSSLFLFAVTEKSGSVYQSLLIDKHIYLPMAIC